MTLESTRAESVEEALSHLKESPNSEFPFQDPGLRALREEVPALARQAYLEVLESTRGSTQIARFPSPSKRNPPSGLESILRQFRRTG